MAGKRPGPFPARPERPAAVMMDGANPGLVSPFVNQALLNIAAGSGRKVGMPASREAWPGLAYALGVKVIHIAERHTQTADLAKKAGEFVSTWSIDGGVGDGNQPAELRVLLMGHKRGAYWYGSRLSIEDARRLAPLNNATSLQVTAAVLSGMVPRGTGRRRQCRSGAVRRT